MSDVYLIYTVRRSDGVTRGMVEGFLRETGCEAVIVSEPGASPIVFRSADPVLQLQLTVPQLVGGKWVNFKQRCWHGPTTIVGPFGSELTPGIFLEARTDSILQVRRVTEVGNPNPLPASSWYAMIVLKWGKVPFRRLKFGPAAGIPKINVPGNRWRFPGLLELGAPPAPPMGSLRNCGLCPATRRNHVQGGPFCTTSNQRRRTEYMRRFSTRR